MTAIQDSTVNDGAKPRARAIQTKLKDYGASISLGQAYEILAVANGHRNWATMNAAAYTATATVKPPEAVAARRASSHHRALIGWNSNPVDGLCAIHVSADHYARHFSVFGEPDDRFAVMLGLAECNLHSDGGMLYVDHSGNGMAEALIRGVARSMGRENDVVVMDNKGGENHLYDPFCEQQSGLGPMRIVTAMAARFSDIDLTRSRVPVRFDDRLLDVFRIAVETARFRAARDHVPLTPELIVEMASAKAFFAAAREDWEREPDIGYWMPLSLKSDLERHCRCFTDDLNDCPTEMEAYHRKVAEGLKNVLTSLPTDPNIKRYNIHRLVRDRKIGILRIDPTDINSSLSTANMAISEIERVLEEAPIPRSGPLSGTKFVFALDGFLPYFMKGVYARAKDAAAQEVVLMAGASHDAFAGDGWNSVVITDPSRLTVKLDWGDRAPGHPVEFDVLDRRLKM